MSHVVDVVGSANIKDTLDPGTANAAVFKVLGQLPSVGHRVELLGLNEWDGGPPACLRGTVYNYVRAKGGGGPSVYDRTRYGLSWTKTVTLVGRGFVGRLPGRKSTLPPSLAAVYCYEDELLGGQVAHIVIHLTADVQKGKGYDPSPSHRRRVARHIAERAALRTLVAWHKSRGRRVYVTGDTNYDDMPLRPLTSCWAKHPRAEGTGTLGRRTVDYVYAPDEAAAIRIIPTASDHDAVVATYIRRTP